MSEGDVTIYSGPERRKSPSITNEQLEQLVERAADRAAVKAVELIKTDFYRSVGKTVVDRVLWIAGALIVAGYVWAKSQGYIK